MEESSCFRVLMRFILCLIYAISITIRMDVQADFAVQREIFDQRLYDMDGNNDVVESSASNATTTTARPPRPLRRDPPYRHALLFEELLYPVEAEPLSDFYSYSAGGGATGGVDIDDVALTVVGVHHHSQIPISAAVTSPLTAVPLALPPTFACAWRVS